ncbi:MAG: hypothetical protein K5644_09445 [Lachnospiraceae bacterium]|nr:hypothetical protein [Lachnospiraceae bacterium]
MATAKNMFSANDSPFNNNSQEQNTGIFTRAEIKNGCILFCKKCIFSGENAILETTHFRAKQEGKF